MKRPEKLIIRPPSEWRSMLLRITRGCKWNRCKFCGIYPALGQKDFSIRSEEEIKRDIDWFAENISGPDTFFLGDSDPLIIDTDSACRIIRYIRKKIPHIRRITSYARASTVYKKGSRDIAMLAEAGLNRIHAGLESGDIKTLKYHFKGQTPRIVSEAARIIKQAGIELSFYVLLGLGGRDRWREHIDGTADLLMKTGPDFIRIRRLWIYDGSKGLPGIANPLLMEIEQGLFTPQTPEGMVLELQRLVKNLSHIKSRLLCDHANNYLNIEGTFPHDKEAMLKEIAVFLEMPEKDKDQVYKKTVSQI